MTTDIRNEGNSSNVRRSAFPLTSSKSKNQQGNRWQESQDVLPSRNHLPMRYTGKVSGLAKSVVSQMGQTLLLTFS